MLAPFWDTFRLWAPFVPSWLQSEEKSQKGSYLVTILAPFWRPKSTKMGVKMSIDFGIDFGCHLGWILDDFWTTFWSRRSLFPGDLDFVKFDAPLMREL